MSKSVEIKDALERLEDALRIACDTLDAYAKEMKALRVRNERMQDMLEELLDYFQDEYDTVDDDNCQPMPNRAMKWGQAIEEALGRGGRYG
jgi:altronate dehydratase